ncbi:MAG TPA: leucyl aminopeptidase [Terriglobales bacterium]|nr:leucyl aminopeptidase [Terriglobales bacterium]
MDIKLSFAAPAEVETECLAVAVVDEGQASSPKARVMSSDPEVRNAAHELIASGECTGKLFETNLIHKPHGLKAKRLLLVGAGKAKTFSTYELRRVAGAAVRALKGKSIKSFAIVAPDLASGVVDSIKSVAEGVFVADFDSDTYKSDRKDQAMQAITVVTDADKKVAEEAIREGRAMAESQNFARVLVNEPSNRMTPTILGERAKEMCAEVGLKCEVYGADKIKELKMGAFWSVAQGSDEPPALIIMTYEPEGAPKEPVLGLVGKGITFDTGGISIKPADGMEKMKYDMAGGAAMIGAMRAIALLKPKVKVIGIVCASENMPSGKAQKPGDVQIAMSGKSIEIINTDAEGRLVLADGLHYARQLGATHLIDAATLTGACVVALGMVNVGVFANDDNMFNRFSEANQRAGEKMWRLPLDQEYFESIRSSIADIMNSGGRWGGAVTAAMFLKEFVDTTPWIHLDIAGTAWIDDNKPWIAKGPSGIAVRSIVEFAREFAANKGLGSKN